MKNQTPKGISSYLLILIVIVSGLLAIGAVLGYQYFWPLEEPGPTPIPKPTSPPDKTANWKTYRNKKYGFEIKYPEDWISHEEGYPKAYLFRKDFSKIDKSDIRTSHYGGKVWPDYLISIIIQDKSGKEYWGISGKEGDDEIIISSPEKEIRGIIYKRLLGIPSTIGEIVKIIEGDYVYYWTAPQNLDTYLV